MAAKNVQLLLIQSVENLGIVGDIVSVKSGYARNYLLPHGIAELPTKKRTEELKEERANVKKELAALRVEREATISRMVDLELTIVRSTNDQGLLYGSVTQKDISDTLREAGYDVDVRFVRVGQPIRRIGSYPIPIQFEKELRAEVTIIVDPDRPLGEDREEMEFDNEGDLIEKREPRRRDRKERKHEEDAPAEEKSGKEAPAPTAAPAPAQAD